jgi:hypothetical protein
MGGEASEAGESKERKVMLRCLWCATPCWFDEDSPEAQGVFAVYCPDADCEDRHAAGL